MKFVVTKEGNNSLRISDKSTTYHLSYVLYYLVVNNKSTDQTILMCRLICAFVVLIWHGQVLLWLPILHCIMPLFTEIYDLEAENYYSFYKVKIVKMFLRILYKNNG